MGILRAKNKKDRRGGGKIQKEKGKTMRLGVGARKRANRGLFASLKLRWRMIF